ncbi:S-adenosyl-L-methionine-dependent methyltransferase [Obelidium mucronatum]|nr:S-adenosyl-L-methionine-dependent methyltransferase [Obelidium mucronatum]
MQVHAISAQGFNIAAKLYRTARPDYSKASIDALLAAYSPTEPKHKIQILEIGSGTGIFTKHFLNHTSLASSQATLYCLEPNAAMRSSASKDSSASVTLKFITEPTASAANIPLESNSIDRVYIAQAFHWFADLVSLREIHRVLKPGGTLGLVWNMEDDATAWVRGIRDLYERFDTGVPQYRKGYWRNVFNESEAAGLFRLPLQETRVTHIQVCVGGKEAIWNRVLSKSYISVLGPDQQERLKAELLNELEKHHIDFDLEGNVLYPYTTDVFLTHKL